MQLRSATMAIALSGAALLAPALLPAQFTTYIAPPRKAAADTAKPPATVAKARVDSVSRMTVADMKAWVDSAAGTSKPVSSASDTALASVDTTALPPSQPSAPPRATTTFSNGAIAPNTATSLLTLLVLGMISLAAGVLLLLRLRPRRT